MESSCGGTSKVADLDPKPWYPRSVEVEELSAPGSSYMGYGRPVDRRAVELCRGTSGADSMRIDAERREGGFALAALCRPEVAAIREVQSSSF
jgi:hypothetical protein